MVRYTTIYGRGQASFEEKRSEFIGHIASCKNEEDAIQFVDEINDKYRDATHNCYAYIIGENSLTQRYSDDGEPQGTAGIPILEVLKKENLTNIACVVTRYYGGKKLGASGLIRAYTKGCTLALEEVDIVEIKDYKKVKIVINYTVLGIFDNWLGLSNHTEYNREYTDDVSVYLYVDEDNFPRLESELMDMTGGTVEIEILEDILMPTKEGILHRR